MEHRAKIKWVRTSDDFVYETYPREHTIEFEGGLKIDASAASQFYGRKEKPNPEEELVGAVSSCHMLTFLAICAKKGILIDNYEDNPVGFLNKNAEGTYVITDIELKPEVTPANGQNLDETTYEHLHKTSHHRCFISNSVKSNIAINPKIKVKT